MFRQLDVSLPDSARVLFQWCSSRESVIQYSLQNWGYEITKFPGGFPDFAFLTDMIWTLGKVRYYLKRKIN